VRIEADILSGIKNNHIKFTQNANQLT